MAEIKKYTTVDANEFSNMENELEELRKFKEDNSISLEISISRKRYTLFHHGMFMDEYRDLNRAVLSPVVRPRLKIGNSIEQDIKDNINDILKPMNDALTENRQLEISLDEIEERINKTIKQIPKQKEELYRLHRELDEKRAKRVNWILWILVSSVVTGVIGYLIGLS